MKTRKYAIITGIIVLLMCLSGCKSNKYDKSGVKVVFELEGGTYQNSTLPVVYYYNFKTDKNYLITDPTSITEKAITRPNYDLEGWYTEKEYINKWNFETDRVSKEGITLYAKWKKKVSHTFNLCYKNTKGEIVTLGSYDASNGKTFPETWGYKSISKVKSPEYGYTAIAYVDENGDPWDMNYKHPGGEESLAINIYLKCIKGIYTVVTTPQELIAAKKNNIYLANDIDMDGAEFNILDYGKEFEGNGYTISNFSLSYDASKNALKEDLEDNSRKSLYITIFGDCKNAVIKNVNFENVSISIKTKYKPTYKIYVLPLAKTLENTKIENVKFGGSVTIVELPEEFNKETNLIVVTDEIYYSKDDKSTIENCEIKLNEKTN